MLTIYPVFALVEFCMRKYRFAEILEYGFSTHLSHSASSDIVHVLEDEQPGHRPRRQRWLR
jgi:hypothetical protein